MSIFLTCTGLACAFIAVQAFIAMGNAVTAMPRRPRNTNDGKTSGSATPSGLSDYHSGCWLVRSETLRSALGGQRHVLTCYLPDLDAGLMFSISRIGHECGIYPPDFTSDAANGTVHVVGCNKYDDWHRTIAQRHGSAVLVVPSLQRLHEAVPSSNEHHINLPVRHGSYERTLRVPCNGFHSAYAEWQIRGRRDFPD
jgi:hypothetical protein